MSFGRAVLAYSVAVANPAQLLLDQLNAWHAPKSTADAARHTNNPDAWLAHRIAVRHLDAIEELLSQMKAAKRSTRLFERYYPTWVKTVFAHPHGWATNGSGRMDKIALEHLEHLADSLEDFVPTIREGGLDDLRDYADEITSLLDEDDTIDQLLRLHIGQVVAHLNWCIDNYERVGDFDLQEAVERLASAIVRAAANSSRKDRWAAAADKWVWPFVMNVVSAIPSTALAQLALGGG